MRHLLLLRAEKRDDDKTTTTTPFAQLPEVKFPLQTNTNQHRCSHNTTHQQQTTTPPDQNTKSLLGCVSHTPHHRTNKRRRQTKQSDGMRGSVPCARGAGSSSSREIIITFITSARGPFESSVVVLCADRFRCEDLGTHWLICSFGWPFTESHESGGRVYARGWRDTSSQGREREINSISCNLIEGGRRRL